MDDALEQRALGLLAYQRAEDAERAAREGLQVQPNSLRLRMCLAESLLMQGRYREGFREREVRRDRQRALGMKLPFPEWDGPLAGRSILVWGEQGLGDEIQAARLIPLLREAGASRITVACRPEAVRVFQQLGADLVVGRFGEVQVPKHDCWVTLWSIPYRLGLRLEDVSGEPYLRALPEGRGGIGLVERGSPTNARDPERSLPEGLLQSAVPQGTVLQPAGDAYDSLCRLAALDLLITVDTSWAHMAGALGVPCWVLLPYRNLDWRWMRERSDSPWYRSLRLFRQTAPGEWGPVLAEVSEALRAPEARRSATCR